MSPQPFETLWDRTHQRLCRFVCSRLSNSEDAEDILQEVYLSAYRQGNGLRDPQRVESWLYQIARNRIIDTYRRRRRWVDLPETLVVEEADEPGSLEGLLPAVWEQVNALPEPYREALLASDLAGMTQQSLAGKMGMSVSGMKSRVQRARAKVKESLARCYAFELDVYGRVVDFNQRCCC